MDLANLIAYTFRAHSEGAAKPSKAVRKWDGKTPYAVHPVWCAMTILHETTLPEDLRLRGAQVLLLHDVLEDTTFGLPDDTPEDVRRLVKEMTFESFNEETVEIWFKSDEARLFKLYDKVSNLLDGSWMNPSKRIAYLAYSLNLCMSTRRIYGELNIMRMVLTLTE
jgi:hypothetical protein